MPLPHFPRRLWAARVWTIERAGIIAIQPDLTGQPQCGIHSSEPVRSFRVFRGRRGAGTLIRGLRLLNGKHGDIIAVMFGAARRQRRFHFLPRRAGQRSAIQIDPAERLKRGFRHETRQRLFSACRRTIQYHICIRFDPFGHQ